MQLTIYALALAHLTDLKLFDIPTTVGKAGRVVGALGASYLTLAGFGGVPMLRAGVEGLADGASRAGLAPPTALAVTMLVVVLSPIAEVVAFTLGPHSPNRADD